MAKTAEDHLKEAKTKLTEHHDARQSILDKALVECADPTKKALQTMNQLVVKHFTKELNGPAAEDPFLQGANNSGVDLNHTGL